MTIGQIRPTARGLLSRLHHRLGTALRRRPAANLPGALWRALGDTTDAEPLPAPAVRPGGRPQSA
ncbi:hypothetical protein [Kitasatospora sp. KL5]|uniref:hypothetical protein n=1 Tax=Kitasatospora sp. KL5 TaxID=3425125 RepID=UPI003D6F435A